MSRRRTSRTSDVAHAYWPHSDPEPAQPQAAVSPSPDDVGPCPGPCNQAFRRAEAEGHDHDVPPHPGKPTWCVDVHAFNVRGEMLDTLAHHGCTGRILEQLSDLPQLATWLSPGKLNTPRETEIDKTSSKGGGARALAHAPSPSPGWDTADELIRWAVDLEDWLRAVIGDEPNRDHVRMLTAATSYLVRNGVRLLATCDAEGVGQDILDTHRRLERLVGGDRLVHRLTEPCPRCGRKGLRRKDGDELVRCTGCRAVWDWDHFQLLGRAYAETVKGKGATG